MKLNISLIKHMAINESKALCLAEYHIIGFKLLSHNRQKAMQLLIRRFDIH